MLSRSIIQKLILDFLYSCKGYYTKDNSVFTLTTSSGRRTAIRTAQAEEKNY